MAPALAVRRVDDAVRDYWVLAGDERIGEIRTRGFGTAELHLRDERFLLRRDDTADASIAGGGLVRMVLKSLKPAGRYSLRMGDEVRACGERRFHLSPRRDGLLFRFAIDGVAREWRVRFPGGSPDWAIEAAGRPIGRLACGESGWRVGWQGPTVPEPVAVFILHAVHQCFGTHPQRGTE